MTDKSQRPQISFQDRSETSVDAKGLGNFVMAEGERWKYVCGGVGRGGGSTAETPFVKATGVFRVRRIKRTSLTPLSSNQV